MKAFNPMAITGAKQTVSQIRNTSHDYCRVYLSQAGRLFVEFYGWEDYEDCLEIWRGWTQAAPNMAELKAAARVAILEYNRALAMKR